jgi:hypothetical protein
MTWADIEKAYRRALSLSFSKKKMVLTFPILVLCGILIVFCRAAAYEAGGWVAMSFLFLPILLSSGILLALGVLLIRIHSMEAKQLKVNLKELFITSMDLVVGALYLSILPILIYLCLWIFMGFFLLLQQIPGAGQFFGVVFSFGPFLLIFASLLLCLFNLGLLFFMTPAAALHSLTRISLAKKVMDGISLRPLTSFTLFFIALCPLALLAMFLSLAALLTDVHFLIADHSLSVGLEWFFIMLPFAAILTPFLIFFFNFSAESYQLLQAADKQQV